MKRSISVVLAGIMALTLAACGGNSAAPASTDTPVGTDAPASTGVTPSGGDQAQDAVVAPTATGEPVYGGEATVYYPKFYNYFDPAMMDEYQFAFWYENLWAIDWSLNDSAEYPFGAGEVPLKYMMGQLADTWDFNADSGVLTVKLRTDVNFQDGAPYNGRKFVADDVVWSYSRLVGLNGMAKVETEMDWSNVIPMLAGVRAVDESTVEFQFGDGFHNDVALTQFVNAKANIGGQEWDGCPQTWEYAKGTGPYVLTNYISDNSMKLERNPNYYGYDERHPENKLPYIDTVNLVYISDSANVLTQAMSGKLDWFGENNKSVLSASEMAQLRAADAGGVYAYMSSSPPAAGFKISQKPFDDINVRIAMQKAIDIELIDSQYFGNPDDIVIPGLWSPSLTSWSTAGTWDDALKDTFKYDPEAAKKLLADAGYPNGFEFTLQTDPMVDLDLYTLAADYLAAVGITMNIEVAAEMMEAVQVSQNPDDSRQFNTYGGGFPEYMLAFFMTGDGMFGNAFNHQDQTYLDMLHRLGVAESIAERDELAQKMDVYFPTQHWAVYLSGMQPSYDFMAKRIGGYNGEKVYYKNNMRTIWSRLWINE